jgi:hypothetical protein
MALEWNTMEAEKEGFDRHGRERPRESTLYAEGVTLLEGDVEGAVHEMSCYYFFMFVHLIKS